MTLILVGAEVARAQLTYFPSAPLRDPQVVIQGTGLRSCLDSVGEQIDPTSQQVDVELLASNVSNHSTFSFLVELALLTEPGSIGLYNGHDAAPVLYEVFPPQAVAGWFAVISYRTNPIRAVVNIFDDLGIIRSTRTYLDADRDEIGFFIAGPQGTFYSQDHRNPGGAAGALFFRGTGLNWGQAWLALESSVGPGSAEGFDDAVLFVETQSWFTSVRHIRWGEVKAWYR